MRKRAEKLAKELSEHPFPLWSEKYRAKLVEDELTATVEEEREKREAEVQKLQEECLDADIDLHNSGLKQGARMEREKWEGRAREIVNAINADIPCGGSDEYHKRIYRARDVLAALLTE